MTTTNEAIPRRPSSQDVAYILRFRGGDNIDGRNATKMLRAAVMSEAVLTHVPVRTSGPVDSCNDTIGRVLNQRSCNTDPKRMLIFSNIEKLLVSRYCGFSSSRRSFQQATQVKVTVDRTYLRTYPHVRDHPT
jgi:hypothetical protein